MYVYFEQINHAKISTSIVGLGRKEVNVLATRNTC